MSRVPDRAHTMTHGGGERRTVQHILLDPEQLLDL
jgi:hypothetical protein